MSEQTSIETWQQITDYEGFYSVSTFGSIRNDKTNKILKQKVTKRGYHGLMLKKPGLRKDFRVHRLVASAFIPNPLHKKDVDHRDRDRSNNNVENLRWSTRSENMSNNAAMGCYFIKDTKRWRARIKHNGQPIHIGTYSTKSEARAAYLSKAKELKGEFAQPSHV